VLACLDAPKGANYSFPSQEPNIAIRSNRSAQNRRLANHLLRERDALFTLLRCPGLEATNWRAEQEIRPMVVTRKVWGGNRTSRELKSEWWKTCLFLNLSLFNDGVAQRPPSDTRPGIQDTRYGESRPT
jgi:hypothetical protein